jgi:hypothetical protein
MPLDEVALRRPEFQEGIKVKLGDGQEWTFPPVRMRVIPVFDGDGAIKAKQLAIVAKQEGIQELNDMIDYSLDEGEFRFIDWMTKRMAAAAKVLLLNYALTGENLAELLYWERDNEESEERWNLIASALMGIRPKVLAAGSE